jgi:MraZ protein
MDQQDLNARIYYNSAYLHEVDEKRRVQIPAKWRPAKEGTELTLFVWSKSNEGPCLRVLPPEKMEQMMKEVNAMPNPVVDKGALKRRIGSQSIQVALDKAGRICIPEQLAQRADIKGQAMLVGLLDMFEIWSPARYEKVQTSDEILAAEAFRLME